MRQLAGSLRPRENMLRTIIIITHLAIDLNTLLECVKLTGRFSIGKVSTPLLCTATQFAIFYFFSTLVPVRRVITIIRLFYGMDPSGSSSADLL